MLFVSCTRPTLPTLKGLRPPSGRPGGTATAMGIIRPSSRIAKGAAREEGGSLRVFDACYEYLIKYKLPASRAKPSPLPAFTPPTVRP